MMQLGVWLNSIVNLTWSKIIKKTLFDMSVKNFLEWVTTLNVDKAIFGDLTA